MEIVTTAIFVSALGILLGNCFGTPKFHHHHLGLTPCAKSQCIPMTSTLDAILSSNVYNNVTFDNYKVVVVLTGPFANSSSNIIRWVKLYSDDSAVGSTVLAMTAVGFFVDAGNLNVYYSNFVYSKTMNVSVACVSLAVVEAKVEVSNVSISANITANWIHFGVSTDCPSWLNKWLSSDVTVRAIVESNNITFPAYDRCPTGSLSDTAPLSSEVTRSESEQGTDSHVHQHLSRSVSDALSASLLKSLTETAYPESESPLSSETASPSLPGALLMDADAEFQVRMMNQQQYRNGRNYISLTISNRCDCTFCRYRCVTSDGIRTTPTCPAVGICNLNSSANNSVAIASRRPIYKENRVLLSFRQGSIKRLSDSSSCSFSLTRSASTVFSVSASLSATFSVPSTNSRITPTYSSHFSKTLTASKVTRHTFSDISMDASVTTDRTASTSLSRKSLSLSLGSLSAAASATRTRSPSLVTAVATGSDVPTRSNQLSFSRQSKTPSRSPTETASPSCRIDMLAFVRNVSILSPRLTPNGSSVEMAAALAATFAIVSFEFFRTVRVEKVISAASSFGSVSSVTWHNLDNEPNDITVTISLVNVDLHMLTLISPIEWDVSVTSEVDGLCLPYGFQATFGSSFTLLPLKNQSALAKSSAVVSQSSAIFSALLLNPVTAMSVTGMMSISGLSTCAFSDIDPLDPSISPLGIPIGQEIGQYYRGAAFVGIAAYLVPTVVAISVAAVRTRLSAAEAERVIEAEALPFVSFLASLRFPSFELLIVSVFHVGLVSVGVSLCRGNWTPLDIALGVTAIVVCCSVTIFCVVQSTRNFSCEVVPADNCSGGWFVQLVLKGCSWKLHWKETKLHFKRCHLSMMN